MEYLNLAALAWLTLFAAVGFLRGLWKSLSGLLAMIGAYWISAGLAGPVLQWVSERWQPDISEGILLVVVAASLFVVSGFVLRLVLLMLLRTIPVKNPLLNRLGGLMVGLFYGGLLGLFVVWGASFTLENLALARGETVNYEETSPLVSMARKFVGRLLEWNARQTGAPLTTLQLTRAMAERPTELMQGLQETIKSPAFQRVVNDRELAILAQAGDVEGLQAHAGFRELMQSPEMRKLTDSLERSGVEWSDRQLAEQAVDIWTRMDDIRNDPALQSLMADAEVQAFLKGEGRLSPELVRKIRALMLNAAAR